MSEVEASIYDRIGGAPAIAAAVDQFYDRVMGDPELAPYFVGLNLDEIKTHQRQLLTLVTGGLWEGSGPVPDVVEWMQRAHAHLGISSYHFDKVVVRLGRTLDALGIPDAYSFEILRKVGALRSSIASS